MKNLFYGEDHISLHLAVLDIIDSIEPKELTEVNVTKLDILKISYDDFVLSCSAIPFMVNKRIVIVKNLISYLDKVRINNRVNTKNKAATSWDNLPEYLKSLPETTELINIEESIKFNKNKFFEKLLNEFQVKNFRAPSIRELPDWIIKRADFKGIDIDFKVAKAIADSVGVNLRIIDTELDKLSLYSSNISERDVEEIVSNAKDANIFHAIDALLDNKEGIALRHIKDLLVNGRRASYIITMIARQLRLIIFAKHYYNIGYNESKIGSLLSLTSYPLKKLLEQNSKIDKHRLIKIHSKLVDLDYLLKTSNIDEEFALEIFISGLRV
ncbi:MAG: DNA polymerase III subunit delta [Chloroflexi bacterium]|nr:DNA polymerase III subunit delta [Chloroflexota bacterium]|tara:strand:+ start:2379 stop:3359 length:981 start_codon:yes stop_codon:yes gene_type:complete